MKKIKSNLVSSIDLGVISSSLSSSENGNTIRYKSQNKSNQNDINSNEYKSLDSGILNTKTEITNLNPEITPLHQSTLSRLSYAKYPNSLGTINITNLAIESLKNREFKNYINEFYDNKKNGWAWHIKYVDIKYNTIYYNLVKKSPKIGSWRSPPLEETTLEISISPQQYNLIINT